MIQKNREPRGPIPRHPLYDIETTLSACLRPKGLATPKNGVRLDVSATADPPRVQFPNNFCRTGYGTDSAPCACLHLRGNGYADSWGDHRYWSDIAL